MLNWEGRGLFCPSNYNKGGKVYSTRVHVFFKCALYEFAYLIALDIHVMHLQIYCRKANHTAESEIIFPRI